MCRAATELFLLVHLSNRFFYPVLNREYAEQIARDWNIRDERSGFAGYVLDFDVDSDYLSSFEIRKVGGANHLEYWIPAEGLEEFNRHIQGDIRVITQFSRPAELGPDKQELK